MEHQFREGDLVILNYPRYLEEGGRKTKGTHPGVEEAIRVGAICTVANADSPDNIRLRIPGVEFDWNVYPEIVTHATAEARAEAEIKAEEERQRVERMMTMPVKPLIDEAKKVLKASEGAKSNSNGVAIHVRRGYPMTVSTGPCHGFIRGQGNRLSAAIVTLLVRNPEKEYGERQCKKEVLVAYYDWLLSRSPYSSCFFGRSGKRAVAEGVTALRTSVPANLLQGALICTRNTWEFPTAINLWYELVKRGVSENAAFVACHFVSCNKDEVRVCPVHRDHISISTETMTGEGLGAFLKGTPLFERPNYNEGGSYQGVQQAFNGNGSPVRTAFVQEFEKYGRVSSVIRNPFAMAKPQKTNTRSMSVARYTSFVKDVFPKLAK